MRPRSIGPAYRLAVLILKPLLWAFTRRRWAGMEHLPRSGGVIVAANHTSYVDPLTLAHALYDHGRLPRYLAKSSLFTMPVVGPIMRGAKQIPVRRHAPDASAALAPAVAALRGGECVVIYPEGTVTGDPDEWPMRARTGVARLALLSGAPVIPLAQDGVSRIHKKGRPGVRLWPPAPIEVRLGPPVDLSGYAGRPLDAQTLHAATDTIMDAVRALLSDMRGQQPPAGIWDPREGRRLPRTGYAGPDDVRSVS